MKNLFLLLTLLSVSSYANSTKKACLIISAQDLINNVTVGPVKCNTFNQIATDTDFNSGSSRWICTTASGERKFKTVTQKDSGVDYFNFGDGVFRPVQFTKVLFSDAGAFNSGTWWTPLGKFMLELFEFKHFELDSSVEQRNELGLYYRGNSVEVSSINYAFVGESDYVELTLVDAYPGACK